MEPKQFIGNAVILFILVFGGCTNNTAEVDPNRYKATMERVQDSVTAWIKNNALYPESYAPVSFSNYAATFSKKNDKLIPGSEKYVILHNHKLLDKDSNQATFSGYFYLDSRFSINRIETTTGNSKGIAGTPETELWTDQFSRQESSLTK